VRVSGLFAWVLWLAIHIFWLIGFRNRFLVLAGWAWAYLRYESGARVITGGGTVPLVPESKGDCPSSKTKT